MSSLDCKTSNLQETQALARRLGEIARPGMLLLLEGPLGAGKTSFVQGLARGLEITDTVNSPTFTLLKEYHGRLPLFHFDLYRLGAPEELWELGFEEYLTAGGVCAVEWGERALPLLPQDYLHIRLDYAGETQRSLSFFGAGETHSKIVEELRGYANLGN